MNRIVSVIGGSECTREQERDAYQLGVLLAGEGYAVVCGGGAGVMEAVARGSADGGGICVGLLPGTDRDAGNQHLTLAIPTGLGQARNTLVAAAGDVVVAIGGEYGTLSEIGFALINGKVVIGIDTWEATSHSGDDLPVIRVDSARVAFDRIQELLEG